MDSIAPTSDLALRPEGVEVRRASAWLALHGEFHQIPQQQVGRLDLCLNEALANILEHGNAGGADQKIALRFECIHIGDTKQAAITVSDQGPPFDVVSAHLPVQPATLAQAQPGGLGLLIIRNCSDTLSYRRSGNHNELTFGVRWADE